MATLPLAAVAVLLAPSLGGLVPPPPLPPPAPAPAHPIRACFGVPLPTAGPDSAFTAMWSLPRAGWTGGDDRRVLGERADDVVALADAGEQDRGHDRQPPVCPL
jgi:hypothetical protein